MIKNTLPQSSRRGFTLVELLVVITIIAVLMGLLFPVVGAAKQQALKAVAKSASTSLVVGITQFYTEYGIYPNAAAGSDTTIAFNTDNSALLKILRAKETASPEVNSRKIPFFSYKDAKGGTTKKRDGFDATGKLLDPWGYAYAVTYDSDYNNQVSAYGQTLDLGAAVWTGGRDKIQVTTVAALKGSDDVVSFQ